MCKIKNIIKSLACLVLYYSGLFHLYIKTEFRHSGPYPVVIINYHRFVKEAGELLEVHPSVTHLIDDFQKEVRFLKKCFDVRSLDFVVDQLAAGVRFNRPTVVITIDDGYKDNHDLMYPVLQEHKIPATVFLSTSVIGTDQVNWYDRLELMLMRTAKRSLNYQNGGDRSKHKIDTVEHKRQTYSCIVGELKEIDIEQRDRTLNDIESQVGRPHIERASMLNWNEVKAMAESGVSFGAHTHTHPILTKMPLEDAKQNIARSKQVIEQKLGIEVKHFAYPNGRSEDFNDELRQFCRQQGFSSISTMEFGSNSSSDDIWALKRIGSEAPIGVFAYNVISAFQTKGKND